jgi:DNA (cytosine-5)-methyltransferase 1
MKVVDIFAGCGGLSLGFMQVGYTVVKAVEFDPEAADTYIENHPEVDVIVDDIKNVDNSGAFKPGDADIIIGGPPCQGFSMAGARIRQGFIDDPRNYLFKHYFNVVKTARPKVFIMENVKGIATMQGGKIFEEIQGIFQDAALLDGKPYRLYCRVVKAVEFGVPQKRERMILIGTTIEGTNIEQLWDRTREELAQEIPTYFDTVTVADAIGNMPPATADGVIENPMPRTEYQKYLASKSERIENHTQSKHSSVAVERISRIEGGQNFTALGEKINSVHSGAYGRLRWDEQASTITTRFDTPAGGRFIHPVQNRTLTPREAARIQSFPDDFVFYGSRRAISRQIGNAVPPKISFFLARLVKNILAEEM